MDVVFEIRVDKDSLRPLERALGVRGAKSTKQLMVKVTNKLAVEAHKALQSKVPIDTGELRNNFIAIDYASGSDPVAYVGIDEGTHLGRDRLPQSSTFLARFLNKEKLRRSQDSRALAPYSSIAEGSPTAGWIASAKKAFAARRRSLV